MTPEKIYEICPICGQRRRRSDCLVCQFCRARLNRIELRNGKILALNDKTRSIIDIFRLVLIRGRKISQTFQRYHAQVAAEKEKKNAELWNQAKSQVVSCLIDRGESASKETLRHARVELLRQLKQQDEEFHHLCRQVIKWEKSAESLQNHLAGIEKKHKEYQEKKAAKLTA